MNHNCSENDQKELIWTALPLTNIPRYLDPDQLQKAKKLATLPSKVGRLPPNRTLTDGVTKFLGALRDFALDHMAEEWGQSQPSLMHTIQ